ncbi:MAG: uracil-DNA glycosylase family protein, partial [Cytophagaceae bacterium]
MNTLLQKIKNCRECEKHLDLGANPIIRASRKSKILVIGQAPGRIVHETSIPWNDKSGDNLRGWLGVD